jgi:hypothetical protein
MNKLGTVYRARSPEFEHLRMTIAMTQLPGVDDLCVAALTAYHHIITEGSSFSDDTNQGNHGYHCNCGMQSERQALKYLCFNVTIKLI